MKAPLKHVLLTGLGLVIVGLLVNWLTPVNVPGAVWACLKWACTILILNVALPVWAVLLFLLVVLISRAPVLRRAFSPTPPEPAKKAEKPKKAAQPWLSYLSDNFFGVEWHWQYYGNKVVTQNIVARCPKCKSLLGHTDPSLSFAEERLELSCHHCGFTKRFLETWDHVRNIVALEIDRKVVTGEYKSVGEKNAQTE